MAGKVKVFYQLLIEKDVKITSITGWHKELHIEIEPHIWKKVLESFSKLFRTTILTGSSTGSFIILGTRKL